ncbi:MAG: hypothetical protein ACKO6N_06485 [Myxococcota bacterium]
MTPTAAHQPPPFSDEECLAAFEACTLSWTFWTHQMHLRVSWLILQQEGPECGLERIRAGIQRYNLANDNTTGYHETITRAWVRVLSAASAADREPPRSFAEFVVRHLGLIDSRYLLGFYRPETLYSDAARAGWVEPDLGHLP